MSAFKLQRIAIEMKVNLYIYTINKANIYLNYIKKKKNNYNTEYD